MDLSGLFEPSLVSTLLTLQLLNTGPHAVVPPSTKLFSLLLHYSNFVTVADHNVNICVF